MARIRETFNGKDAVAHAWSRQDQERGREADRAGGRIFFEGPTIYSYGRHFPIATFHQKKGKEKIVLFTTREYSPTTRAHKFAARGAVSHYRIIYCESPTDAERGIHGDNMRAWEAKAQSIALNLAKATKPEKYLSQIARLRAEMKEYAEYFGISQVYYEVTGGSKKKIRYLLIESKEGGVKATAKEIAARKKYDAQQAKARAEREARAAADFHSGEEDTVRDSEWTYLRFQAGEIQTSKGIKIDFHQAKEYYSRLKSLQFKCKNGEGVDVQALEIGMVFGVYRLKLVTSEHFEIGCHKIKFSELDRVAKLAGLVNLEYFMTTIPKEI